MQLVGLGVLIASKLQSTFVDGRKSWTQILWVVLQQYNYFQHVAQWVQLCQECTVWKEDNVFPLIDASVDYSPSISEFLRCMYEDGSSMCSRIARG